MIFFQDEKKLITITYDNLLYKVNSYNKFNTVIKEDNADDFFVKLIFNLCYNIDTVIIDNDASINERTLNVEDFLTRFNKDKVIFETWNDLLEQLLKTTSKISIFIIFMYICI